MAEPVELHVRVRVDGLVTAETKKVTGTDCLDYISVLEDLLEASTVDSAYTAEYTRSSLEQHEERNNELRQY